MIEGAQLPIERTQIQATKIFVLSLVVIAGVFFVALLLETMYPRDFKEGLSSVVGIYGVYLAVIVGGVLSQGSTPAPAGSPQGRQIALVLIILWNVLLIIFIAGCVVFPEAGDDTYLFEEVLGKWARNTSYFVIAPVTYLFAGPKQQQPAPSAVQT